MMWYGGWGGWLVMAVMMVLFWAVVIGGGVALVHYVRGGRRGSEPSPYESTDASGRSGSRAEDVLAERFARGEIEEEEYRRRLALLREQR